LPSESWRLDTEWGTTIELGGCQAGLAVDGRCDILHCQYRTTIDKQPDQPIEPMALLCPRDKETREDTMDAVVLIPSWYKPECVGCDALCFVTVSRGVVNVCDLIEAGLPCKVKKDVK